jgi:hypothetical protein
VVISGKGSLAAGAGGFVAAEVAGAASAGVAAFGGVFAADGAGPGAVGWPAVVTPPLFLESTLGCGALETAPAAAALGDELFGDAFSCAVASAGGGTGAPLCAAALGEAAAGDGALAGGVEGDEDFGAGAAAEPDFFKREGL